MTGWTSDPRSTGIAKLTRTCACGGADEGSVAADSAPTPYRRGAIDQSPAVMFLICRSPSGIAAPDLNARHKNSLGVPV